MLNSAERLQSQVAGLGEPVFTRLKWDGVGPGRLTLHRRRHDACRYQERRIPGGPKDHNTRRSSGRLSASTSPTHARWAALPVAVVASQVAQVVGWARR